MLDGPNHFDNVFFDGFLQNDNRSSSALGWYLKSAWETFAVNDVKNLKFGFEDGVSMEKKKWKMDLIH